MEAAVVLLLLRVVSATRSVHLADLPPIALSLGGELPADGSERALNARSSTLVLQLSGDTFSPLASDAASNVGAALLAGFESQQPHEPAGWAAVGRVAAGSSLTAPPLRSGLLAAPPP